MTMSDDTEFRKQLAVFLNTIFPAGASAADISFRMSFSIIAIAGRAYQGVHGGGPPHLPQSLKDFGIQSL
jgi:hypothetical protein